MKTKQIIYIFQQRTTKFSFSYLKFHSYQKFWSWKIPSRSFKLIFLLSKSLHKQFNLIFYFISLSFFRLYTWIADLFFLNFPSQIYLYFIWHLIIIWRRVKSNRIIPHIIENHENLNNIFDAIYKKTTINLIFIFIFIFIFMYFGWKLREKLFKFFVKCSCEFSIINLRVSECRFKWMNGWIGLFGWTVNHIF
jgi:hypothetical protein